MRNTILLATSGMALVTALLCAAALPAQSTDKRLETVLRDWSRRREQFKKVRYTLVGERVYPKGIIQLNADRTPMAVPLPKQDTPLPLRRMFLLDLLGKRFRLEIDEKAYGRSGVYPIRRIDLFDGKEYKILHPRDPNPDARSPTIAPDVAIVKGDASSRAFELAHWPLFDSLGIVQSMLFRSTADKLVSQPESDLLFVQGDSIHQGRQCIIIRTHAKKAGKGWYEEYWVDPARESVVVKHLVVSNKVPVEDFVLNYEKKNPGWTLTGWTYTRRRLGARNDVTAIERVRVQQILYDEGLGDPDFTIQLRPGMVVARTEFTPGAPGPGQPTFDLKQQEYVRLDERGNPVPIDKWTGEPIPSHRRLWPWLGCGFALAVVSGLMLYWRWRRGKLRSQARSIEA